MYSRLLKIDPNYPKSFFLFGPRGTGKTAWLRTHFKEAIYFDLLNAETYLNLQQNPTNLSHFIPDNYPGWIILDEVQKLPSLLNEVHRLIENKRYRFILTGSSARKLRQKGVNLLAGRAILYHMHPLTALELGQDFDLKRALLYGQLPSIPSEPDPKNYLHAYVTAYLKEEVQQEALVRNLDSFSRFLHVASFSQGSPINLSSIARETGVSQKVISHYFKILNDLLLAKTIPVFTKRAKRELAAHPKFYYFDVGVYRTLRPRGPLDISAEIDSVAAESLFLQEIFAINDYFNLGYTVSYWRTKYGHEVDFILYGEKGFKAFEIKTKAYLDKKDFTGLNTFKQDYPEADCFIIYAGTMKQYVNNKITAIPIQEALMSLPEILA